MTEQFRYTDERFADIQMLRYRLDGFEALTLRQKLYIYYLAKATLCGRDITTDQFGRYNLRIRKVLEAIYERYEGDRTTEEYKALETYLKRVWFSNAYTTITAARSLYQLLLRNTSDRLWIVAVAKTRTLMSFAR